MATSGDTEIFYSADPCACVSKVHSGRDVAPPIVNDRSAILQCGVVWQGSRVSCDRDGGDLSYT